MLNKKLMKKLDSEIEKLPKKLTKSYKNMFDAMGFTKLNEDFVHFWSVYSDEIFTKEGTLIDFSYDMSDFENSQTAHVRKHYQLSDNYFSLFSGELEDYLLYEKSTDKVFLISADGLPDFMLKGAYLMTWNGFIGFLEDQIEFD